MPQTAQNSRRFWIAAVAVVMVGYLIISRAETEESPSGPLDTTSSAEIYKIFSSTTIDADFLKDYKNFEDCKRGWSEPNPVFSEPIGCFTITFKCSSFQELNLSFSQTKQDIADGLAVSEDLAVPIQDFVADSRTWIGVPENDPVRKAFDEMTVSLRKLRVALLTEDNDSASKLGTALEPLINRVQSICRDVPEQDE